MKDKKLRTFEIDDEVFFAIHNKKQKGTGIFVYLEGKEIIIRTFKRNIHNKKEKAK